MLTVGTFLIAFTCLSFVPEAAQSRDLPPATLKPLNPAAGTSNSSLSPGEGAQQSVTNSTSNAVLSIGNLPAKGDQVHSADAAQDSNSYHDSIASDSRGSYSSSGSSYSPLLEASSGSTDSPQFNFQRTFLHLLRIHNERDWRDFLEAAVVGGFQWAFVCLYLCIVLSMWWRLGWLW